MHLAEGNVLFDINPQISKLLKYLLILNKLPSKLNTSCFAHTVAQVIRVYYLSPAEHCIADSFVIFDILQLECFPTAKVAYINPREAV